MISSSQATKSLTIEAIEEAKKILLGPICLELRAPIAVAVTLHEGNGPGLFRLELHIRKDGTYFYQRRTLPDGVWELVDEASFIKSFRLTEAELDRLFSDEE